MTKLPPALIEIIDARDNGEFVRQFALRVPFDWKVWFLSLLRAECSEHNYQRLITLAWFFFVERQGHNYGEPIRFSITSDMETVQELLYKLQIFSDLDISFSEWASTYVETQRVLGDLLTENIKISSNEKTTMLKEFISGALEQLIQNPVIQQRYCEYLNGAY